MKVYIRAIEGLVDLEPDWNKQRKYIDFIDAYADLDEDEVARYRAEFIDNTGDKAMGLAAILREEGRQQGKQEGEAALLLRQLERRFGPQDPNLRERVRTADADTPRWYGASAS